jgi:hypothetical protein
MLVHGVAVRRWWGPVLFLISLAAMVGTTTTTMATAMPIQLPQLNGQHFRITAVQETGFLDINAVEEDGTAAEDGNKTKRGTTFQFSGYLVDMLKLVSIPERANFTYELVPPSGYGSACSPRLTTLTTASNNDTNTTAATDSSSTLNNNIAPYDARYWTQYNCGADDVNDDTIPNRRSDFYLGMFYVTPKRQLVNQFTIPFLPPTSGTLTMFGTATDLADFTDLARQQMAGTRTAACGPAGTALLSYVATAYPGLQVKGIFGGENEIYDAFASGECEVYIVDGPIAAQTVLRYSKQPGRCHVHGKVRSCTTRRLFVRCYTHSHTTTFFIVVFTESSFSPAHWRYWRPHELWSVPLCDWHSCRCPHHRHVHHFLLAQRTHVVQSDRPARRLCGR